MAVLNVHERTLMAGTAETGALIDTLASTGDRLWPHDTWPPMRFDRPLGARAAGGHGPVRYTVQSYVPGQWIRFRFTGPTGFHGWHEFTVHSAPEDRIVLRHTCVLRPRGRALITWPLIYRPLHDALIEDSLDRAERELPGEPRTPAHWSGYVRLLRGLLRRR